MTTVKAGNNIFEALGFDKDKAENLRIRTQLMMTLKNFIRREKLSQTDAAKIFAVSQPRISDLTKGKVDKFTIDMLVNMLAKINQHVEVKVTEAA